MVRSATFVRWLRGLRDSQGRTRIEARLRRVELLGHFGDTKALGDGISEMRIHVRPGYRLYYTWQGSDMVVLLCGGEKDSQSRDIELAKEIAKKWEAQR